METCSTQTSSHERLQPDTGMAFRHNYHTTTGAGTASYIESLISHPFRTRKGERRKTTESFLELLSAAFMECHTSDNPLSYDIIRIHTALDFEITSMGIHENSFPETTSLEEHLANVSNLKRLNPSWNVGAYNFTAVMEHDDQAIVWFTSKGTGGLCEWSTNRESVSQLYWRKRHGDNAWECYKHLFVRGPGNLFTDPMQEVVPLPKILPATRMLFPQQPDP